MRSPVVSLSCLLVVLLVSCSDLGMAPTYRFPETLLESGSDSDRSYASLQTKRLMDGSLVARVTGWGIRETGLFLSVEPFEQMLTLRVMSECGTITQATWEKVHLEYTLSPSAENAIDVIHAVAGRTELVLSKSRQ